MHLVGMALLVLVSLSVLRLFELQVIRHSHFKLLASQEQLRKFEVQPDRGSIYASDRGQKIPLVMNRTLKRIYADPRYISDKASAMSKLAAVTKGSAQGYLKKLDSKSFYVVLKNAVEPSVAHTVSKLELEGIGIQDEPTRVYPESSLAAQMLGFVNGDGDGQYGVEESFNKELSGTVGLLNATTDTRGIPIATSDNYRIPPRAGSDVVLTIDRNIQAKIEGILAENMSKYRAKAASAVVMDPNSGAVLGMANIPTYRPDRFNRVSDYGLFQNRAVSGLYEPGSVIKAFTMATGLETGAVTPTTTYRDSGSVRVGDRVIKNASGISPGVHTMNEVITKSINTGVVFVLSRLGGGEINALGKERLHKYFTQSFGFGKTTGIDLPSEAGGTIFEPTTSDVDYANMTFGQGMSATMLQVISGYAAIANGGTYWRPYVVDQVVDPQGNVTDTVPKALRRDLISPLTERRLKSMFEGVVQQTGDALIPGYHFGGKSGTAQTPDPAGGYFENRDIGSFVGMAPLDHPQFVVIVRIDEPQIGTFASAAARPMAGDIMRWLLSYQGIAPQN